jgi:hypothetical protein
MTLFTLVFLLSVVAALTTVYAVSFSLADKAKTIKAQRITNAARTLTLEEIELLKKYAELFGIGNDAHDLSIEQLLEMGKQMEATLGYTAEELEVFVQAAYYQYITIAPSMDSRGKHHCLNNLMSSHSIIGSLSSFVSTKKIFGGDKDGEPTISTHTAA